MDIDKIIAWLKTHDKLTMQLLAEKCGVPYHTLRKVASGETRNPGVYTMLPISAVYEQLKRSRKRKPAA